MNVRSTYFSRILARVLPSQSDLMLRLRAVLSASGRSCVSTFCDRSVDVCLGLVVRLLALRDAVQPDAASYRPDLVAGILARLHASTFTPDEDDVAAALLAQATEQTVWIERTPLGTRAAVCGDKGWR